MSDEEYTSEKNWEVADRYRDIVSNSAESLWENALSYFAWCEANPIQVKKTAMSGKEAGKKFLVEMPVMYTIKGLCIHCNILEEYLRDLRQSKDSAPDYYNVVSKILYIIHDQNMTYAALDLFNPILVGRLHNIDKDEVPVKGISIYHVQGLPKLAESENEVLKNLESEDRLWDKTD